MKIANKSHTAVSMVQEALNKAEQYADRNIFTYLNTEAALKQAAEIDARIAKGQKVGRLAGVPYALKDNFLSTEGPTSAGSLMLANFVSPVEATVVADLRREDAIMLGRVNMDAFAHGSSTENSYFGVTKNAVDPTCVSGGSSGGSAVAVALDIVQFATGSDTGGSIRQPASFNGVYGLKPTYGAVSRYGVVAMASSTDSIGFFTKNPEDMDLLMQIAAHRDENDATSLPDFYETIPAQESEIKPVIGVIDEFDTPSLHPAIRAALREKITELETAGYKIVHLSMPMLKYALAVYYIVVPAEVASNLSRHDGIRYGHHTPAKTLSEVYQQTRQSGLMPENKRRIMIGNFVLSSGFFDAYYLKAQKVRTLIIEDYQRAFRQCDFILTPVAPNPAFKIGEKSGDPVAMYLEDVMSTPVNLAGLPALAFPVSAGGLGATDNSLPVGLQVVGPRKSDANLIRLVSAWQKVASPNSALKTIEGNDVE